MAARSAGFALAGTVCAMLSQALAAGAPPAAAAVPDYRWVVEDCRPILQPKDLGLAESTAFTPEGLTFARNGDLLMAASSPGLGKAFIVRSADRGRTWTEQGVLEYRSSGGDIEGMYMTRAGRLVLVYYELQQDIETTSPGWPYYVPGGNNFRLSRLSSRQWGVYSDDEGKTWHYVKMDIRPLQSMDAEASSQIFEDQDGTLVASFRGHLSQDEMDAGITSNGVVRSHNGGKSWGDASVIARGVPGSRIWFNESQVLPLSDGRWLCMMRAHDHNIQAGGAICRSYSNDRGRTWTYPVRTQFNGGETGMGFLPDGSILCTQTGPGWTLHVTMGAASVKAAWSDPRSENLSLGLLYEVTCDSGLTWPYFGTLYLSEPGSGEHVGSPTVRALDQDTAIVVYHRGSKELATKYGGYGPLFIGASWLRKVALSDPRVTGLNREP
jgi:hypothetical protein